MIDDREKIICNILNNMHEIRRIASEDSMQHLKNFKFEFEIFLAEGNSMVNSIGYCKS